MVSRPASASTLSRWALRRTEWKRVIASACAGSEKAAVVYLLFYEKENEEAMTAYTNRLKAMVEVINPKRTLTFHVWQVEVTSIREVEDTVFTAMKKEPVYRFGAERLVKL